MQCGWIFLDLLLVCLVVSGHGVDPHCSLAKHWCEKPWDSSQSQREPEKTFEKGEEGCKALLHTQERQAVRDDVIALNPESLWASSCSWDHGLCPGDITPLPKVTIYPSEPTKEHNSPKLPAEISVMKFKIVLHEPPQPSMRLFREKSVLLLPN